MLQQIKKMYHSFSCEANNFLDSEEFLHISWTLNARYRVHGSQSCVPLLSQMISARVLVSYIFNPYPANVENRASS
jgi:hypothetical protein